MNRIPKHLKYSMEIVFFCCLAIGMAVGDSLPAGWKTYNILGTPGIDQYGLSGWGLLIEPYYYDQLLNYSAVSPDFNEVSDLYCYNDDCSSFVFTVDWTGTITRGLIQLTLENLAGQPITMTGVLTNGWVRGSAWLEEWDGERSYGADISAYAAFSGTWPNGGVSNGFFGLRSDSIATHGALTFTPEPTGLLLLGSGALILGRAMRRSHLWLR